MLARDLGLERAERDLLSTDPQIEEITARGPPDKILTSRLTDDVPFRSEREDAGISHLPCNAADGACAITCPVFFSSTRSAPGSFVLAYCTRSGSRYRRYQATQRSLK